MKNISFFSDLAGCAKLFNEFKNLIVSVLELRDVGDVVEIAEVGVDHLHHHDRIEWNIYLERLSIFISKFDESA